jgi:hypothetical protein
MKTWQIVAGTVLAATLAGGLWLIAFIEAVKASR